MRTRIAAMVLLPALALAACASTPGDRAGPRDLTPVAGAPALPRGALYANCLAQAAAGGAYDRTSDPDTHLLRFTCTGEPAQAFYAALEAWSAARDSQWTADGRTWRSTARVIRNLFGVDYCSSDAAGDVRCVIVLNVGDFLAH